MMSRHSCRVFCRLGGAIDDGTCSCDLNLNCRIDFRLPRRRAPGDREEVGGGMMTGRASRHCSRLVRSERLFLLGWLAVLCARICAVVDFFEMLD